MDAIDPKKSLASLCFYVKNCIFYHIFEFARVCLFVYLYYQLTSWDDFEYAWIDHLAHVVLCPAVDQTEVVVVLRLIA